MIFDDPTSKVERQVKELASPSAEKRLKAVSVLSEVAEADVKPLKIALPALMDALGDGSADIRSAAAELLDALAKSRTATRKEIVKGVLCRLSDYGDALEDGLALLGKHTPAAKDAVEEHLPALVGLLEDGREAVRESAREALEQAGVPARKYCNGLAEARAAIEEAARCGADLEKADYMLRAARTAMSKGYFAEVDKDLELARELAQNARRLVRLWRMKAPDVRAIDLSSGARFVAAAGSDGKVRLVDASGAALWSASVAEGATALRISPDESMVVAAGGDGHLHAFGRRGEKHWSFRMSAPAAALAVTDGNLTVACCNDNNIYTVGPAGALVSKQWTERPGRRLGVSGDGEQVVVTFRDHNVHCYDRNMFLRWKYSGGIWNDVAISQDGESIVAGAQGCDVAMFSKIGMVAWKARAEEPVTNVAISAGGDCVYSADPHALQAWHRSGKPLLRYRTGDPVRCMACDSSGEYLAVGLADRFVLVRNREMVRLLVEQSGVLLDNVARLGVDTARPAALLEKARSAFEANDSEGGSSAAGEARRLLDEAKNQRAEALVASVQQVIRDAKGLGGDTAKAEQLVKGAAESLRRGHMDRVLLLLGQAREEAEISRRVREEVARAEKEARVQAVRKAIQEAMAGHGRGGRVRDRAGPGGGAPAEGHPCRGHRGARPRDALHSPAPGPREGGEGEAPHAHGEGLPVRRGADSEARAQRGGGGPRPRGPFGRHRVLREGGRAPPAGRGLREAGVPRGEAREDPLLEVPLPEGGQHLLQDRRDRPGPPAPRRAHEAAGGDNGQEGHGVHDRGALPHLPRRPAHPPQHAAAAARGGQPDTGRDAHRHPALRGRFLQGQGPRKRGHPQRAPLRQDAHNHRGGRWVHLALVISGMEPEDMRERMRKTLADIEDKYRSTLETWDGDASKLWGAKKMVEPLITWM